MRARTTDRWAGLAWRLVMLAVLLLAGGLAGGGLVRLAPGFGMDERMLDTRLSEGSREVIGRERSEGRDLWRYYAAYLGRLGRGDLGTSASLGRPVRELLGERLGTSARSGAAGLALAWMAALGLALGLEGMGSRRSDRAASAAAGALLCAPAAIVALACLYAGAPPAAAVAAILFPRLFRYLRNILREAAEAPHVLAARARGTGPSAILFRQIGAPVLPEVLALAGISVSMAVGTLIPVEALCDSPGVGQLVWQAALARDLPVIVNVTLLITLVTAAANLGADLARAEGR